MNPFTERFLLAVPDALRNIRNNRESYIHLKYYFFIANIFFVLFIIKRKKISVGKTIYVLINLLICCLLISILPKLKNRGWSGQFDIFDLLYPFEVFLILLLYSYNAFSRKRY